MQLPDNYMTLLFGASSLTALTVGLWGRIKSLITRLIGLVFIHVKVNKSLGGLITSYAASRYKRSQFGDRLYFGNHMFVRPLNRIKHIAFQFWGGSQLFWIGKAPLWVRDRDDGNTGDTKHQTAPGTPGTSAFISNFTFLRWTIDWEKLIEDALEFEDAYLSRQTDEFQELGRFRVIHLYGMEVRAMERLQEASPTPDKPNSGGSWNQTDAVKPLKWTFDQLGVPGSKSSLSRLSLDTKLMSVVEEVKFWASSKKWYQERGVPWKRGYLFYGEPGTGKTSLARALAEELDLPVFIIDLSSMSNSDLQREWRNRVLSSTPCMVLLEDIDSVFRGRENISKATMLKDQLTFDCLLNCIDGVDRSDGVLTIVTTNKLDSIDTALGKPIGEGSSSSSRPGRIDSVVEFTPLDSAGRLKMAERILKDSTLAADLVQRCPPHMSAVQFQERCFQVALQQLYKETKGLKLVG